MIDGGGLYIKEKSNYLEDENIFENTTFQNNTASANGGGAFITGISTTTTFKACVFLKNFCASISGIGKSLQGNPQHHSCFSEAELDLGRGGGLYIENGATPFILQTSIIGMPLTLSYFL